MTYYKTNSNGAPLPRRLENISGHRLGKLIQNCIEEDGPVTRQSQYGITVRILGLRVLDKHVSAFEKMGKCFLLKEQVTWNVRSAEEIEMSFFTHEFARGRKRGQGFFIYPIRFMRIQNGICMYNQEAAKYEEGKAIGDFDMTIGLDLCKFASSWIRQMPKVWFI